MQGAPHFVDYTGREKKLAYNFLPIVRHASTQRRKQAHRAKASQYLRTFERINLIFVYDILFRKSLGGVAANILFGIVHMFARFHYYFF